MDARRSSLQPETSDVPRRFVTVDGRAVHYRVAGDGPAVVLLHDSPRSSRLHLETIRQLSRHFRVFALDTPGYGNSQPLGDASSIEDFAEALGAALGALGLSEAPLYATHTSAKIALEYAASLRQANAGAYNTAQPTRLILDGLSIPSSPTAPGFIKRYMRPFHIEETGGYLAAEWTRMRDMVRWFPWFDQRPDTRMPIALPDEAWFSDYIIDFFSAGPNYASAYGAAMRYNPMPALRAVACPTLIAAKADDVLVRYLDDVPLQDNPALSIERLPADRDAWLTWLEDAFTLVTADVGPFPRAAPQPHRGSIYVDLEHGPVRVHRAGPENQRPLLILSAPTTLDALRWQAVLPDRATLVPELPGFGESAPLPDPSIAAAADALAAMLGALDVRECDVLAAGLATPLGAALAARRPDLVSRVILDGCYELADAERSDFAHALCPAFPFDSGGGHIHRYWHMLRDAEASWPWHSTEADAHRTRAPLFDADGLHAALVGILKQPAHYGDIARAGCNAPAADRYPPFDQPALLLAHPDDPAYRGTAALAARLPGAVTAKRLATIEESAELVSAFLSCVPVPCDEVAL